MFVTNGLNTCISEIIEIIITSHIKVILGIIYFTFLSKLKELLKKLILDLTQNILALIYEKRRTLLRRLYGTFQIKQN